MGSPPVTQMSSSLEAKAWFLMLKPMHVSNQNENHLPVSETGKYLMKELIDMSSREEASYNYQLFLKGYAGSQAVIHFKGAWDPL